jgi:hypothetical protein
MSKNDKGRLPPFVPLLVETLGSPAWRAMSHGARSLYVALRGKYMPAIHNNGRINLSQRQASKELGGSNSCQIARWFRELQHFGFIVMTDPGCLGVDGKGRAPSWRLTELGYMKDNPTRDFLQWNGTDFVNKPRTESRTRKAVRPVRGKRYDSVPGISYASPEKRTRKAVHA